MRIYIDYLRLLWQHKVWVYKIGRQMGLSRWRLLKHDLSKLLPSEFVGYCQWKAQQMRAGGGGLANDRAFGMCFFLHIHKRNAHHWQWHMYTADSGETYPLEIPEPYRTEMLVDWCAAGIIRFGKPLLQEYYDINKGLIHFHPATRLWVETELEHVEVVYVNCTRP